MRSYEKKQLLSLLDTMRKAPAELLRLAALGQADAAKRLLSETRACLSSPGGLSSFSMPETAPLLARCGKALALLTPEPDAERAGAAEEALRAARESAAALRPNRLEAVFFPYMASMWDSMASVWEAAQNDPSCDAYVVPVPYFDRLPDHSLGAMHYDGALYPDGVPVTDWETYDPGARHPDIAFVHNPYDERNYVTSVHPRFFCRRLKAEADLLAYIPYFVTADDVPAHFCVCPGTFWADRVFVQSDAVRETYLREFSAAQKADAGRFSEKFAALGSPKFDRVLRAKREDFALPAAWRRVIERPGGARKTVVLCNTSLAALLAENGAALDKLEWIFRWFREEKDAALLWRPHPLSAATYGSMRPALLRRYLGLTEEYRRAGFGIYDDSAQLDRAIAVSDAYYGDFSSLAALYLATGKPVLIPDPSARPTADGDGFAPFLRGPADGTFAACCFTEREGATPEGLLRFVREGGEAARARARLQAERFAQSNAHADGTAGAAIYRHCRELTAAKWG